MYRQRVAVCVGINRYNTYPHLRYAVTDAIEMANVFERMQFDRVVLLTDENATRDRILQEIQRFQDSGHEEDLLVFYFAGHGWTGRDSQGEPAGYLLPYDCQRGEEMREGLSMADLSVTMDAMKSRHVLILVDACYSGYGIRPAVPVACRRQQPKSFSRYREKVQERSIQILTAGGAMDLAFESDGHGLFTRHVLDCLRSLSAETANGVIFGTELAMRVRHNVVSETGGWQKPRFGCNGDGDVALTVLPSPAPGLHVAMAGGLSSDPE